MTTVVMKTGMRAAVSKADKRLRRSIMTGNVSFETRELIKPPYNAISRETTTASAAGTFCSNQSNIAVTLPAYASIKVLHRERMKGRNRGVLNNTCAFPKTNDGLGGR